MSVPTDALAVAPVPAAAQVTGDPAVSHGIGAVGGQADFMQWSDSPSAEAAVCRARGRVKDEDAVVVRSEAKFILRADHAHRHLAPNLALFDLERIAFQGWQVAPTVATMTF